MKYELWRDEGDAVSHTFIKVDENYAQNRRTVSPNAQLVWSIEVENHDDAMKHFMEYIREHSHKRGPFVDWD